MQIDGTTTVPTSTSSTNFLQQLKSATALQHTQLEAQELLAALMSPTVNLKQYACYLKLMLNIEEAYETCIIPVVNHLFNHHHKPASHLVKADLQQLGYKFKTEPETPFHIPAAAMSIPYALGFKYVMEGSKLGGKFIFKHINRTLGFDAHSGASFLANAGADTGKDWKHFLAVLCEFIAGADAKEEEAIAGARYAFSSIFQYYQTNRHLYAD